VKIVKKKKKSKEKRIRIYFLYGGKKEMSFSYIDGKRDPML